MAAAWPKAIIWMEGTAEIESWFQSVNSGNPFDALIFNRILNRNETPLEDKEKKRHNEKDPALFSYISKQMKSYS